MYSMTGHENRRSPWFDGAAVPWASVALALGLTLVIYREGIAYMVHRWSSEEYSYAWFIPALVAFFIWQKKNELAAVDLQGSWLGFGLVVFALFMYLAGEFGTLYTVIQYGFVLAVMGGALALLGRPGFRLVLAPLAMLLLVVPLPSFLYNNLSASLQLISSEWGVWVIRQFGIAVHLEGNVIDLGVKKLQVVEACSGLRYLFPLMAVGLIVAYLYRAPFWKRALVFLSTIPITVLMNSLRIGLTGIAVEYWGMEVADDFLHYFEGWVVFMVSLALLLGMVWLLTHVGRDRRPFGEVFSLDFPGPMPAELARRDRRLPAPFVATLVVLLAAAVGATALPEREEVAPPRAAFEQFPMKLGGWQGRPGRMEQMYIDVLKFDDYVEANYVGPTGKPVNLYVAWYASQRKGESAHSPRTCIPGGGWRIVSLEDRAVPGATVNGQPLRVNRTVIQKGDDRQLVYYWFQQRGRVITNEYLVKWYLFTDAVMRNRTDGALVRLTTMVPQASSVEEADRRLGAFAAVLAGELGRFVPD